MSFSYDTASVNSSNATIMTADPVPIYHMILVRTLALVVDKVGYVRRIFTVVLVTASNIWELALIKYGVTRRVHSLPVSLLFYNTIYISLSNSMKQ